MKQTLQAVTLFVSLFFIATLSEADELRGLIEAHFAPTDEIRFLSYEQVEQPGVDRFGAMHYLVMDFASADAHEHARLRQVHAICSRVLRDDTLIRTLSREGVDMVSVSFDRQSQYDCL